jgi:hypothetical protein
MEALLDNFRTSPRRPVADLSNGLKTMLNIVLNISWRAEERKERREKAEAYDGLHCIESNIDNECIGFYL